MRDHIFKASNRATTAGRLPYTSRRSLLSDGELRFFGALQRAVGQQWGISIKTRLADVIFCPENLWNTPHGRKLAQKHIDFVLYDRTSAAIAVAIELDDKSHDRADRARRDAFLDQALAAADVLLLRVAVSPRYRSASIRRYLGLAIARFHRV